MLGIVIFASLVYYGERLQANPHNDFKVRTREREQNPNDTLTLVFAH